MNKEMKLNCPMCEKEFTTTRRDKIWCDVKCSRRFLNIKKSKDSNRQKHKRIENDALHYDLELDKFYIKSMRTNK